MDDTAPAGGGPSKAQGEAAGSGRPDGPAGKADGAAASADGSGAPGGKVQGAAVGPGGPVITTEQQAAYRGGTPLRQRFPTILYLRRKARTRLPGFAFEYADGGAGSDLGIARNWAAFDSIELIPRYGVMPSLPPIRTQLFGRSYSAPFGISPMGGPAIVWPGADALMATAAQKAGIPYTLGTTGGITVEEAAALAPDVLWFQLYRMAQDDFKLGLDLVRRCQAAGVHALVLTMDVPVRTVRPREVVTGLGGPGFMYRPRSVAGALRSPGWLAALWRHGQPRFASLRPYLTGRGDVVAFARKQIAGAYTWDEVARFREAWTGPLILKGILHPEDAEMAVALGSDGIWVSNHGGRQLEALPAAIDALPAIAAQVGSRATVVMDSGVRSGTDVVRALALGAQAAFAGKAFLWGLGALGPEGPTHVIDLLRDETRAALGQLGATTIAAARDVEARHPGALGVRTRARARE